MRSFEQVIEQKTTNTEDCLHFLEQYTRGQPKELTRSCQHMSDGTGYARAKALLHEHFGDEYKIAAAYMDKISACIPIKAEDGKALQAYGLFLRGCCNAMEEVHSLCELNTPANMLTVMKKLPYKMRDKWRTIACDLQERNRRRAMFVDIVNFIEHQVKIATDPVFGNIQDDRPSTAKEAHKAKQSLRSRGKESSFATTIATMEQKSPLENKLKVVEKVCLFCKGEHMLDWCPLLERKTNSEKIDFLKKNGICFGCLCTGHISKECRKRLTCKTCGSKHPSILHIYQKKTGTNVEKDKNNSECTVDSSAIAVQTSGLTGAGKQDFKLAIVPVKVKSKKSHKMVETYAFLDPGSSASFCTVGLMDRLDLSGRNTRILLRTMGQEKIVESGIVSNLEVSGLGH